MSKRSDGAAEAASKTDQEIIAVLQNVEDRPFNAWELGHLDVLISRRLAQGTRVQNALGLALKQNYHLDKSNAAIHGAVVRFSPLTFRLAECLADSGFLDSAADPEGVHILSEVLGDRGRYEEDPGR